MKDLLNIVRPIFVQIFYTKSFMESLKEFQKILNSGILFQLAKRGMIFALKCAVSLSKPEMMDRALNLLLETRLNIPIIQETEEIKRSTKPWIGF